MHLLTFLQMLLINIHILDTSIVSFPKYDKILRSVWGFTIGSLRFDHAPIYDAAGKDYFANAHARGSTSSAVTLRRGVVAWSCVVVESQRCSPTPAHVAP